MGSQGHPDPYIRSPGSLCECWPPSLRKCWYLDGDWAQNARLGGPCTPWSLGHGPLLLAGEMPLLPSVDSRHQRQFALIQAPVPAEGVPGDQGTVEAEAAGLVDLVALSPSRVCLLLLEPGY